MDLSLLSGDGELPIPFKAPSTRCLVCNTDTQVESLIMQGGCCALHNDSRACNGGNCVGLAVIWR